MRRPEQQFHKAVADFLAVALGGSAWFTSIAHGSRGGGAAGHARGAIWQGMGAKAGVPDILLVDGGRAIWLELKAPKGRLSDVQKECHKALAHAGSAVHVVRTIDEVIVALRYAGVPLRIVRGEAA